MKRSTSLFIITVLLSACSAMPDSTATHSTAQAQTTDVSHGLQPNTTSQLNQEWQLTAVQGVDYQGRSVATLDLTDPAKASAHAGCNTLMFGISNIHDNTLHISSVASTRMACPDMRLEQILGQVLPTLTHYKVSATDLILSNSQGQALYFKAVK
ncbi:heat-inducible protein [Moraxella caprae]|uniref:Heat-inducible protein n=1 Tax=Moraxella caprae TaxID=90240 RepID=A0A378QYZ4_9GAMM|nr:META domain-containing protein [Moraxella caprae]STZ08276.1 heat-inducible protein [Moraxella caprae]